MKIKTRLQISAIFFVCVVLAIGLTLFFMSQRVNEALGQQSAADEIVESAFELNTLAGDYLLHQEERAASQWYLKHASLSNQLAGLEFKDHGEQAVFDEMREIHEDINATFSQLVASYEGDGTIDEKSALQEMLAAQLSVKLQSMVSTASLLSVTAQETLLSATQTSNLLVTIFVTVIAAGIGANSFLIISTIGKPITKLHHGVERIENGNLDHRVGSSAKDEIGQLSRAFDEMTLSLSREITKHKKARAELASSEEFLNSVIEHSPVSLWISDSEGTLIKMNQSCRELFGATDEEAVGKYNILKDNLIEEQGFMPLVENVFEKGEIARFTIDYDLPRVEHVKIKGATHRILDVIISPIKDMHGKVTNAIFQHKDITERKRMAEELRHYSKRLEGLVEERTRKLGESEERHRSLVQLAPDSILTFDLKGVITACNVAASRSTGYTGDEIIGKHFSEVGIIRTEDLPKYVKLFSSILRGKTPKPFEVIWESKKGTPHYAELHFGLIKKDGETVGIQVIGRDITERKRLQEKLLTSEKLAAIGQLASVVGHEIRNPLGVIKNSGYFLNMKLKGTADEKVMKHLKILEKEVDSANLIISDLLDFARKKPPALKQTDLNDVVMDALSHISIPENIKAITKLGRIPPMLLDKEQIRRVFQNLILNAVQAMPKGGELKIQTSRYDDSVKIVLKDTGVGIPKENLSRLFTPLFSTKAKGVGLGLSICKQIAESHGGNIAVKSKVGKGSAFTVRLPIRAEEEVGEGLPITVGLPVERRVKSE